MKLKFITITTVFAFMLTVLSWQGCKKDSKDPECTLPNATLSYNLNIKGIIDQQCLGCHVTGSGVVGAVGDFSTYEGIKPYLDNRKVLDRVVVTKDMPQGGGMSQAQRDSINCWIAAGYPK